MKRLSFSTGKRDLQSPIYSRAIVLVIIIIALFPRVRAVVGDTKENVADLPALSVLATDVLVKTPISPCYYGLSLTFPEAALMSKQVEYSGNSADITCLQQQLALFPQGRSDILAILQLDAYWESGYHEQACKQIKSPEAIYKAIQLAQQSAVSGDYETTAIYLDCIEWMKRRSSHHSAAMLYRELGIYYQERGMSAEAFRAYKFAGELHPTVWAEPYIAQSDILWHSGQQEMAIQVLESALARSTNATATYQLARALGLRLEEMGLQRPAYCAMRRALQVEGAVALNSAPETWRMDLRQRISRLEDSEIINDRLYPEVCDGSQ
ncbi:MAG: tetratricopeptide repeat protein [Chloroflexi bacterium]|nr:tetratricopeptide repeat protein [Chloroflexota bacterium]